LLGLAWNCIPPDLCLLSSWDYKHEPLFLARKFYPGTCFVSQGPSRKKLVQSTWVI
jgi:hypothetical protein